MNVYSLSAAYIGNIKKIKAQRPAMTIEIAEDWFKNNISGETGYTLDSENEIFLKTILEDDLTFEFASDSHGEFFRKFVQ